MQAKVKTKTVTKNTWLELLVYERGVLLQTINNSADYLRGTKDWTNLSLETKLDPNITEVYIMGTLEGRGTAWFDDFELKSTATIKRPNGSPCIHQ